MKRCIAFLCILVLTITLGACGLNVLNPPSVEKMDEFVTEHKQEIDMINTYLLELESENVHVISKEGSVLIDVGQLEIERQVIDNDAVREAVRFLWRSGCIGISKNTRSNAIVYKMWKRTYDEAVGGSVYAIDPSLSPEAQFQTELTPLSSEGWYYFLAEYNKWRLMQGHSD